MVATGKTQQHSWQQINIAFSVTIHKEYDANIFRGHKMPKKCGKDERKNEEKRKKGRKEEKYEEKWIKPFPINSVWKRGSSVSFLQSKFHNHFQNCKKKKNHWINHEFSEEVAK